VPSQCIRYVPTSASEDSPSSLGGGIEEVIILRLSISPKAYTAMKRCMIIDVNDDIVALASSSVDALHPKTRNLSQTEQCTPRPMTILTPCPPNLRKYFKKGA